ncbi:MAG: hypothetical protein P4L83_02055 [Nevskia sp.]|nr:hypothetical protein [Nevskia sp.]
MRAWRDAALFHLLFGAAAAGVFYLLRPPQLGWGILGLVGLYNLLLPLIGSRAGHHEWLDLWIFLLPLSLLQVLPDWVLTQQLGILGFPDLGGPRLGPVPAYMAGMWVIPLFWVLWLSEPSLLAAALLSLLLFGVAEWAARPLHLWQPLHVAQTCGVAYYVLPAEMLLGWAAAYAFREVRGRNPVVRLWAAACVSTFYTGALVLAYFLSTHVALRLPH